MARILAFALLATMLGGCAIVPLGHRYHGDGYSRGYGDYRDNRHRDDNRYRDRYDDRRYGDWDRGR